MSKEWKVPFHVFKVDVSKAFDTVSQPALSAPIRDKLVPLGLAWEAPLWVDLVENRELEVYAQGQPRPIRQTNGVRQGSPDSPVIFASVIGDVLNEALAEEQEPDTGAMRKGYSPDKGPALPHHGSGFQDDIYLWALHRPYLQQLLGRLVVRLAKRNLAIHANSIQLMQLRQA